MILKLILVLLITLNIRSPSDRPILPELAAGYLETDNLFGFPQKTTNENGVMTLHPGFEWTGGGLVSNSSEPAFRGWLLFRGSAMSCPYMAELLNSVPISEESADKKFGSGDAIYHKGSYGLADGYPGTVQACATEVNMVSPLLFRSTLISA